MATMPSISQPAQASKVFRLALQAFAALLISILVGIAAAPAQAQVRPIPADAKLAKLKLGVFPDAELNGKSIKLGPGTRIYNRDNIIVIPSTVKDLTMTVAYVTGSLGEVVAVWILTNDEIRQVRARQKRSG